MDREEITYAIQIQYKNICTYKKQKKGLDRKIIKAKEVIELLKKGLKRCGICHDIKYLDEFYRNNIKPDKRNYRCKECQKEYMKSWKSKNK